MTTTHQRPDHARELRYALVDVLDVCERLGLLRGRGSFSRQAGGVIIRCPWHEDRSPSCSVRRGPDGTIAVKCHGCQATGDVLSLVAVARGLNTRSDFRQVLREAAELAGQWGIMRELEGREAPLVERPVIARPPAEPERTYPPAAEVGALWSKAGAIADDEECSAWLSGRAIDPAAVAGGDFARVLKTGARLPWWASYRRASWLETGHRLVVPMHDPGGEIRSVRVCRVRDGESPKRLPPGGHRATALVMADEIGLAMLRGTYEPARVVVTEGEPDFMTWATRRRDGALTAVLGIVTGSWTGELAARIPHGAEVVIRTDHDRAGESYAQTIHATLKHRCFVRRGGRAA